MSRIESIINFAIWDENRKISAEKNKDDSHAPKNSYGHELKYKRPKPEKKEELIQATSKGLVKKKIKKSI